MEAIIRYLDGVKFEVEAGRHRVICDQPATSQGADCGMTPPDFLLASLGTCCGFYAVQYLRTRDLDSGGLQIRVTAQKAKNPSRLAKFQIEVETPFPLDERQREGMLRAVKSCLIHHTLQNPPEIDIRISVPVSAAG
ncbi:MAG: OsmC family protein [Bryobacterales bacterium]|nr:OsmC family protein [Bryobacterales bacterium]